MAYSPSGDVRCSYGIWFKQWLDDKHDDLPNDMDLNVDFSVCYVKSNNRRLVGDMPRKVSTEEIHLDLLTLLIFDG